MWVDSRLNVKAVVRWSNGTRDRQPTNGCQENLSSEIGWNDE